MQLEYGLAELGDRRLDRGVRTGERLGRVASVRGLLEIVPRREQVLDRMVVEPLGQDAALPLAGAQGLGDQPAPTLGELGDLPGSPLEHRRQEHGRKTDPEHVARLDGDEARCLRPRVRRMSQAAST